MTARIAVLASGGGSNLQALFDHLAALGDARGGDVVLVASNRREATALDRARSRGIAAEYLAEPADGPSLAALLQTQDVDLVVLAGYLKLVPAEVTAGWSDHVLNVHPALLPAFGGSGMYGRRVHEAVLAHGARVTGATVHLVNERYDEGRILAQWPVPVMPDDTAAALAARVLRVEHLLYPRVIDAVAAGRLSVTRPAAAIDDAPGAGACFDFARHAAPSGRSIDALLTPSFTS